VRRVKRSFRVRPRVEPVSDRAVVGANRFRVEMGARNDAAVRDGNAARLLRSARKWRDERGAVFDERELVVLGIPRESLG